MPRAFIAVKVDPTPALASLLEKLGRFGRPVHPVASENLHITLSFLGQIQDSLLDPLSETILGAAAGTRPFDMPLVGLGAYPNPKRPTVIWVGATHAEALADIVQRLNRGLGQLGLPIEHRPWSAHLTVARVKARPPEDVFDLLDAHRSTPYGSTRVDTVSLVLSQLDATGPRYTVASRVALNG